MTTTFIEFLPVVIVGFVIAFYKSLKHLLDNSTSEENTQKTMFQKVLSVLTDGIGGSLIGGIVYGFLSATEYSMIIKVCISAIAAFIGIDKVAGWIAETLKKKVSA